MQLNCLVCTQMRMNKEIFVFLLPIVTDHEISRKLTFEYVCQFAPRSHDQKYLYLKKYVCVK